MTTWSRRSRAPMFLFTGAAPGFRPVRGKENRVPYSAVHALLDPIAGYGVGKENVCTCGSSFQCHKSESRPKQCTRLHTQYEQLQSIVRLGSAIRKTRVGGKSCSGCACVEAVEKRCSTPVPVGTAMLLVGTVPLHGTGSPSVGSPGMPPASPRSAFPSPSFPERT